jgi:phosphoenolpyruvate carboxykinase (ATP)
MSVSFNLQEHGVTVAEVHRNLPIGALYEHTVRHEKDASIVDNGALAAYSGVKTGRSAKDKRVVKHPNSEAEVWWGPVNIPIAGFFIGNFKKYENGMDAEVSGASPVV